MNKFLVLAFLPLTVLATEKPHDKHIPTPITSTTTTTSSATATASAESTSGSLAQQSLSIKDRLQIPTTASPTAPAVYASGDCSGGDSKAITTPIFGASKGKTSPDLGCERREWVRILGPTNPALALKVACSDPIVAAVATGNDCVYVAPVTVPDATLPVEEPASKAYVDEAVTRAFKNSLAK